MSARRGRAKPEIRERRASEPDLSIDPAGTVGILTGFIRSEVLRTGRSRVVLGLSGGIDSALAAYLAVRALGAASVTPLLLPYKTSSPDSIRDAELVVGALGMVAEKVDITPMVDAFTGVTGAVSRNRLGNVMARARMMVLYDRSEAYGALVLGTSNKTELLLGYGTLYGDMASALNPLGDLYKTQVRALAAYLRIPASIRRKAPSADLWPRQADETDLGFSYERVDRLLALLVDARLSREAAVTAGFEHALVDRVSRLVVRSQFKRHQPIIAKVSARTVGWDFRYPRDWRT
jgi:NAD+ synthase